MYWITKVFIVNTAVWGLVLYIMSIAIYNRNTMQESLCADAASFDLTSGLLTACISEAKNCIDISVTRREQSNDKTLNPDNFAILRGNYILLQGLYLLFL